MTKDKALYEWFQGFGMPFYPATALPPAKDLKFPYGTYEAVFASFGETVYPTVNMYFKTASEATPNKAVDAFEKAVGNGGTLVECDGGAMWIKKGQPFVQAIADHDNSSIKRRLISIAIEFLTTD